MSKTKKGTTTSSGKLDEIKRLLVECGGNEYLIDPRDDVLGMLAWCVETIEGLERGLSDASDGLVELECELSQLRTSTSATRATSYRSLWDTTVADPNEPQPGLKVDPTVTVEQVRDAILAPDAVRDSFTEKPPGVTLRGLIAENERLLAESERLRAALLVACSSWRWWAQRVGLQNRWMCGECGQDAVWADTDILEDSDMQCTHRGWCRVPSVLAVVAGLRGGDQ